MEIKEISTQTFLVYSTETTLTHVNTVAIREVDALYGTAKEAGLQAVSPLEFIYWNTSSDDTAPITLEIALPVAPTDVAIPEKYSIQERAGFKAVLHTHVGDFSSVSTVYEQLYTDIFGAGLKPKNQVREVYKHWVDLTSPENITDILIEIE